MKDNLRRINELESVLRLALLVFEKKGQFSLDGLKGEEYDIARAQNSLFIRKRLTEALNKCTRQYHSCQMGGIVFDYTESKDGNNGK